jgi:hypothetical protein
MSMLISNSDATSAMNDKRVPVTRSVALLLLCAATLAQAGEEVLPQQSHAPGIELPAGEGRTLLLAACTRCHDLRGLPAYRGYWNSARWREMVDAMIKNGAPLDPQQAGTLAEYLATHFGRPATPSK